MSSACRQKTALATACARPELRCQGARDADAHFPVRSPQRPSPGTSSWSLPFPGSSWPPLLPRGPCTWSSWP